MQNQRREIPILMLASREPKAKANLQLLQTSTNLRAPPLCEGMHAVQAYTATEWSDGTRHKIEQVKYFEILKQVIWLYFGCLFF